MSMHFVRARDISGRQRKVDLSSRLGVSRRALFFVASVLSTLSYAPPGVLSSARAQAPAASAVDERTTELRRFRERLRSADDLDRMAAFELGSTSDDAVIRQLTFTESFRSKYKDLQTAALRSWISSHHTMVVELTLPDKPTEATTKAHDLSFGEGLLLEGLSVNAQNEITAQNGATFLHFTGQFTPGGLILLGHGVGGISGCALNLAIADETHLSGAFRCQRLDPILAKVSLL
jgi:hypothetical protein